MTRLLTLLTGSTVVAVCLWLSPSAAASLQLTETTVSSSTRSFRALLIEDNAGTANIVRLNKARRSSNQPIGTPPTHFEVVDLNAGVANVPASCRIDRTTSAMSLQCPFAAYDTIGVFTGAGDDDVSSQLPLPALTLKQMDSPDTAIYLNVGLGEGNDLYTGTDYEPSTEAIFGDSGRDVISGGESNDLLDGGSGKDDIEGRGGKNVMFGGPGADHLGAGLGNGSIMIGGRGRDFCSISSRKDRVRGCERYGF